MADSSDIWDLGRSALMAGRTKDENICYLSHEKSNYTTLQKTILFRVTEEGGIEFKGTSRRKDRDYMADNINSPAPSPKMDEAIDFIIENVEDGMEVAELEKMAKAAGITLSTLREAKAKLKKDKRILISSLGFGKDKKWLIKINRNTTNERDSK